MTEGTELKLKLNVFKKFSEKISAIAYYKGKIAVALASSNQRIEVWNSSSNARELTIRTDGLVPRSLKFDDSVIMSMFEEIKSWDITSGRSSTVFKGGVFRCCSFDYLKILNVVVGSFSDSSVYIWNMSTGDEVKQITLEQGSIQKVSITPKHSEEDHPWKFFNLLTSKDKEATLWTVKFNPSEMQDSTVFVEKCITIESFWDPCSKSVLCPKLDSVRYHEKLFYCFVLSADTLENEIVAWGGKSKVLDKGIKVDRIGKNLLAVGEKYIAVQTEVSDKTEESFVVIDKSSGEEVAVFALPKDLCSLGADWNPSVIIGDTSWLDGLNKENEQTVFCICVCNRQTVHVFKLAPEVEETSRETSSEYCNLL